MATQLDSRPLATCNVCQTKAHTKDELGGWVMMDGFHYCPAHWCNKDGWIYLWLNNKWVPVAKNG